jgi:hypothetical protein
MEGYLERAGREIGHRREELRVLEREVESIPEMGNKERIEGVIRGKEKELVEIRNKLSKLANVNSKKMEFKSAIPAIESKINYSRQKIAKDL